MTSLATAALRRAAATYETALEKHPMLTKAVTGWALAALGDGISQAIQSYEYSYAQSYEYAQRGQEGAAVDLRRTYAFSVHNGLWTAFGLHPILNAVDRLLPGVSVRAVALKTLLRQKDLRFLSTWPRSE